MKHIILFGANCGKCKKIEVIIKTIISMYNIDASFEKTEDVEKMIKYNITYLPSVILDNKIVFKGIIPSEKEVKKLLLE